MKTGLAIIDKLYTIINVTGVTSLITGHIWKHERPRGQDENLNFIVINCLPIDAKHIQKAYANINIFCKKVNGADDTAKMLSVFNAIQTALSNRPEDVFDLEDDSNHIIDDYDDPAYSYLNIRLETFIEKN